MSNPLNPLRGLFAVCSGGGSSDSTEDSIRRRVEQEPGGFDQEAGPSGTAGGNDDEAGPSGTAAPGPPPPREEYTNSSGVGAYGNLAPRRPRIPRPPRWGPQVQPAPRPAEVPQDQTVAYPAAPLPPRWPSAKWGPQVQVAPRPGHVPQGQTDAEPAEGDSGASSSAAAEAAPRRGRPRGRPRVAESAEPAPGDPGASSSAATEAAPRRGRPRGRPRGIGTSRGRGQPDAGDPGASSSAPSQEAPAPAGPPPRPLRRVAPSPSAADAPRMRGSGPGSPVPMPGSSAEGPGAGEGPGPGEAWSPQRGEPGYVRPSRDPTRRWQGAGPLRGGTHRRRRPRFQCMEACCNIVWAGDIMESTGRVADPAPGLSVQENATINELVRVTLQVLDRGGRPLAGPPQGPVEVPEPGDGLGERPSRRRRVDEAGPSGEGAGLEQQQHPRPRTPPLGPMLRPAVVPRLTEDQASQVLLSERIPLVIQTLLRSLWPGGGCATYPPDAYILSRLWNAIREYDMFGVPLEFHLNYEHEHDENLEHRHIAYRCRCWTERLGEHWELLTRDDEMAMLPEGIERRPPDKLKRILTAMLDNYIKTHPLFPVRNPRYASRQQTYIWPNWVKVFLRAFLKLAGIHDPSIGHYWYLSDPQATLIARLTGLTMSMILRGMENWRSEQRVRDMALSPEAPRFIPITTWTGPDDLFNVENERMAIRTIPDADLDDLKARCQDIRNYDKKKIRQDLNNWYRRSGNKRRGNHYMEYAERLYNELAQQLGAPELRTCWEQNQQFLFNEQIFNITLESTLEKARRELERRRTQQANTKLRIERMRRAEQRAQRLLKSRNEELARQQARARTVADQLNTLRERLDLDHENFVPPAPPAPPPMEVPVAEEELAMGEDLLTLEEILLTAVGISETARAQYLSSPAISTVISNLRRNEIRVRIGQNVHLARFRPPDIGTSASAEDRDMWDFELFPPEQQPPEPQAAASAPPRSPPEELQQRWFDVPREPESFPGEEHYVPEPLAPEPPAQVEPSSDEAIELEEQTTPEPYYVPEPLEPEPEPPIQTPPPPQAPYQPPAPAPVPAQAPIYSYDFCDDLAYLQNFESFLMEEDDTAVPGVDVLAKDLQRFLDEGRPPASFPYCVLTEVNLPALPPREPGLQPPAERTLEVGVRIREPAAGSAAASSSGRPKSFEVSPRPSPEPGGATPVTSGVVTPVRLANPAAQQRQMDPEESIHMFVDESGSFLEMLISSFDTPPADLDPIEQAPAQTSATFLDAFDAFDGVLDNVTLHLQRRGNRPQTPAGTGPRTPPSGDNPGDDLQWPWGSG